MAELELKHNKLGCAENLITHLNDEINRITKEKQALLVEK
jgi:hypothetical protein